jgi:hypothetical protein
VLPVLAHGVWQVETVEIDLGDGLREWIEIRRGDTTVYAATVAERDVVLGEHGVEPVRLAQVDTIDDGCE